MFISKSHPALRGGIQLSVTAILLWQLAACSTERNFRGVPETTWNQLTAEQKQLIVDRSFQDEMKDS